MSTLLTEVEVQVLPIHPDAFAAMIARGVVDAAAILDEHIVGWHERVHRPIDMLDVNDCILGQVFGEPPMRPARFFGLISSKQIYDGYSCGWGRGLGHFKDQGVTLPPFVFCADEARPHWEAEIEKRRSG